MTGFAHDPYDAEWENPNTGRTVHTSADDDYCDCCGVEAGQGDCDFCAECAAADAEAARR